jgi:hypothetical protein
VCVVDGEATRHPIEHICPKPANLTSSESLFLREAAEEQEAAENELGTARKAGDVVRAEQFLKRSKPLAHPG